MKDRNSGLNHPGRALGQLMIQNGRPQREIKTALGISGNAAAALMREVQRAAADADQQSPVPQAESSKRGAARLDDRDRSRSQGR